MLLERLRAVETFWEFSSLALSISRPSTVSLPPGVTEIEGRGLSLGGLIDLWLLPLLPIQYTKTAAPTSSKISWGP